GREVALITAGSYFAGTHTVLFDASSLASGVYFYKLTSGDFTDSKKMVLIK
ncbi:MAG: T9SS C-terminal target domain-containing protein, partial [Chlorobiota bacterium]